MVLHCLMYKEEAHLLFQLTVDRQDLRMADKGKGQDGHSVRRLGKKRTEEFKTQKFSFRRYKTPMVLTICVNLY